MVSFDWRPRIRVVFGQGAFTRLGELARELGLRRPLLVADRGIRDAGFVGEAMRLLGAEGIDATPFDQFEANPDSAMVETGRP